MAQGEKVKHSDLIEDNVFEPTIKQAEELDSKLKVLITDFKVLLKATQKEFKTNAATTAKDVDKLNNALKNQKTYTDGLNTANKKKAENEARIKYLTDEQIKGTLKFNQLEKLRKDILKDQIILEDKHAGVLVKTLALNRQLRRERDGIKKLDEAGKARIEAINKAIDANNKLIEENSDKLKKQKMNVGNYTDSIKKAFEGTALFSDVMSDMGESGSVASQVLGKVAGAFKRTGDEAEKGEKKGGKFLKVLKSIGLASALLAIGSMQKSFASSAEATKDFQKVTGAATTGIDIILNRTATGIKGFFTALSSGSFKEAMAGLSQMMGMYAGITDQIKEGVKANSELLEMDFKHATEIRKLNIDLKKVTLDMEDYNEISNDQTLSYKEKNAALEQYLSLSKEQALIGVDIASKELEHAQKVVDQQNRINKNQGATKEQLDALNAATLKQIEATDQLNDIERHTGEHRRARAQEELIHDLELIRSKKKSSTAQHDMTLEQLRDERLQLEEREKIAADLLDINRKTFDEQIRLIKERTKKQFDANDLLATRENILLADKLKKLGLSAALEDALATIIKKTQDAEIEGEKEIAKLDEEKIKRTQKILEIERQISKDNAEAEMQTIKDLQSEIEFEKSKETNVRRLAMLREKELLAIEKENELKKENRIDEANSDKQKIENSIFDTDTKAKEIYRIENKLKNDLALMDKQADLQKRKSDEDYLKFKKDLLNKEIEETKDALETILSATAEGYSRQAAKEAQRDDEKIQRRQRNVDAQRELANKGLKNQLAYEEQELAKAELRKRQNEERARKRDEALQLAKVFLDFLSAFAKTGDPNNAELKAVAKTFVAKGISDSIAGAYKDGVENLQGSGTETSDSNLAMLSKGESVVTAKATKENTGLVTAMNKGKVEDYLRENYDAFNSEQGARMKQDYSKDYQLKQALQSVVNAQLETIKAVKNIPVPSVKLDGLGNWTEEIQIGLKKEIIHKGSTRRSLR